jgi:ferredoxin
MTMNRRQFLRGRCRQCGCRRRAIAEAAAFGPREPKPLPPKAVGMLYDSTLCIGCKACVSACKQANGHAGRTTAAAWPIGTRKPGTRRRTFPAKR